MFLNENTFIEYSIIALYLVIVMENVIEKHLQMSNKKKIGRFKIFIKLTIRTDYGRQLHKL